MNQIPQRYQPTYLQRIRRVRATVNGTATRPRLSILIGSRSNQVQLIDDATGQTLASATDLAFTGKRGTLEGATFVGTAIATAAKTKSITHAVLDRRGRRYHGRVRAIAEAARENGLSI